MKMGENRAKQEQAAQQQAPPQQQQAAQPKPAAAPSAGGADMTAQLNNLNQMHQSGALSDEEYAAAKKKLLG
jgi:membrane protease subunit (stomatin/prohibitin family)